jgi:hypothetical protein
MGLNKKGYVKLVVLSAFLVALFAGLVFAAGGKNKMTCSDSDGGINPWTFGTVSATLNGDPYAVQDTCYSATEVSEAYCSGSIGTVVVTSCGTVSASEPYCMGDSVYQDVTSYGCVSGACSAETVVVPQQVAVCTNGCDAGVCNPDPNPELDCPWPNSEQYCTP